MLPRSIVPATAGVIATATLKVEVLGLEGIYANDNKLVGADVLPCACINSLCYKHSIQQWYNILIAVKYLLKMPTILCIF